MINYAITQEKYSADDLEIENFEPEGEFLSQSEWDSFSMMVELLRGAEPSQYPLPDDPSEYIWFTQSWDMNIHGIYENRSYHPQTKRDARYMLKAWRYGNKRKI